MKRWILISLLSILVIAGCTNKLSNSATTQNDDVPRGVSSNYDYEKLHVVNLSDKKTTTLSFELDIGDRITLNIEQPPVDSVVRVSQIEMPDGTMDGPFSSQTNYTATSKGEYKFRISENMMATNTPYTGNVNVNVKIEKIK